jgi:hypothetical protein
MSFSLRITFGGLCLFAPDRRNGRLHVLLIKHHHEHLPRLRYNKAYETEGSSRYIDDWQIRRLNDCTLKLDNLGDPIDLFLPRQVIDLNEFTPGARVDRLNVEQKTEVVAARVTIDSGNFTSCGRGARWITGSTESPAWQGEITTCVEWTINVQAGNTLDLSTVLHCGSSDQENKDPAELKPPTLHPIDGNIHLFVYNEPREVSTKDPVKGEKAEHFDAYYDLLERNPEGIRPRPTIPSIEHVGQAFYCIPEEFDSSDRAKSQLKEHGILTIRRPTCITARADVG